MMKYFIWGAVGGLVPVVATLIVNEGHPFTTYLALIDTSPVVVKSILFYCFQIVVLFAIGGVWAYLNKADDALKAFQLGIAAPAVIVGTLATQQAKEATENDPLLGPSAAVVEAGPVHADMPSFVSPVHAGFAPEGLVTKIQFRNLSKDLAIRDLPKLFGTVERRFASDRLIALYPENKREVVAAVIAAIEPEKLSTSYQVNIYVARTLRLIPDGWEGTPEQRRAIDVLKADRNYRDATFKANVDGALRNWKQGPL